jgi:hypothetical protein
MRRGFFLLGSLVLLGCPPEPALDCLSATDCDDDNACTTDSCDESLCNNTPVNIDDQIDCTADACDPANGQISHTPQNNLCDDSVGCTVDVCIVAVGCESDPDDNLCNNGDSCDPVNDCQPGVVSNPSIDLVVPNNGLANANTDDVILTGDDLLPGASVTFGGIAVLCQNVNTPTQLSCDVPSTNVVGPVDIVVTNTDGQSVTVSNAFTYTGVLNETDQAQEFNFCNIQFPDTTTATVNQASDAIFGRIFEGGLTDAAVGQAAPGVTAEIGFGPQGSNPTNDSSWRFSAAVFNIETGFNNNDDEYGGTLTISTAGTFSYTYRFSVDGGLNFTYCDLNGAGSDAGLTFEAAQLGTITVQ